MSKCIVDVSVFNSRLFIERKSIFRMARGMKKFLPTVDHTYAVPCEKVSFGHMRTARAQI